MPFPSGELGPHLTQCILGRCLLPNQAALIHQAVWPQQTWVKNWGLLCPFGGARSLSNTMWLGAVVPLWGELGPYLTQCGQGGGLPPHQVAYCSTQPFGHNTPTPKTGQTDRQRSNNIGRTVLQTVAQKAYLSSLQGNKIWQICAPFALVKDRMLSASGGLRPAFAP